MTNKKLIVNLDGPRGVGKTTQIHMISSFFKNKGVNVQSNTEVGDWVAATTTALNNLNADTDLVLNEGSFLRILAEDAITGMSQKEVLNKHRKMVEINEITRFEHNFLNIIIVCENTDVLLERIVRLNELTGSNVILPDPKKEADILNQMIGLEKSMFTLNTNTKLLYIEENQSMIEVRDELVEIIDSSF